MENIKVPVFKKNEVRITEFGAVGDGVTLNTLAFEKQSSTSQQKAVVLSSSPKASGLPAPLL